MPNERKFEFSEMYIFGKFDLFTRRLKKIIEMFETMEMYSHLQDSKIEGEGRKLCRRREEVEESYVGGEKRSKRRGRDGRVGLSERKWGERKGLWERGRVGLEVGRSSGIMRGKGKRCFCLDSLTCLQGIRRKSQRCLRQ